MREMTTLAKAFAAASWPRWMTPPEPSPAPEPTCTDDCARCAVPDPNDPHDRLPTALGIGYCLEGGFFVTAEDGPGSLGCEDFREA